MDTLDLKGKKYEYFKKAVELFSRSSFEIATLNDVADSLGMKRTNFYNYFKSKQEILDLMYAFFTFHFYDNRKTLDQLKPIIKQGTVLDLIKSVSYTFPEDIRELMTNILTVIHQRKYFDETARKLAKDLMIDEGIRYTIEVFNYAIDSGRLDPFDVEWLAVVINDTRNGEYMRSILDTEHNRESYIENIEERIYRQAAALITDRRPVYSNNEENDSE